MMKALLVVAALGLLSITAYIAYGARADAPSDERAVPPPPPPAPPTSLLHASAPAVRAATPPTAAELPPENSIDPRINQDPRINRDRIASELRASGRGGDSKRLAEAAALLEDVRTETERDGDVRMTRADCYRTGCIVDAQFKDGDSFFRRAHAIGQSTKDRWSGGLFLSGPVASADGSVSASLVLFTE